MRAVLLTLLLAGCAGLPTGEPISIGMTEEDVFNRWGRPASVNRTQIEGGFESQQWVYEAYLGRYTGTKYSFVYFRDGKVVAIQD